MHKLYIKNMVCGRCITAVQHVLEKENLAYAHIRLGEVILNNAPDKRQHTVLKNRLNQLGFGLLNDQRQQIIERIKNTIVT